jgi:hypothetical protein
MASANSQTSVLAMRRLGTATSASSHGRGEQIRYRADHRAGHPGGQVEQIRVEQFPPRARERKAGQHITQPSDQQQRQQQPEQGAQCPVHHCRHALAPQHLHAPYLQALGMLLGGRQQPAPAPVAQAHQHRGERGQCQRGENCQARRAGHGIDIAAFAALADRQSQGICRTAGGQFDRFLLQPVDIFGGHDEAGGAIDLHQNAHHVAFLGDSVGAVRGKLGLDARLCAAGTVGCRHTHQGRSEHHDRAVEVRQGRRAVGPALALGSRSARLGGSQRLGVGRRASHQGQQQQDNLEKHATA